MKPRKLRMEQLEEKRCLAIVWANEFATGQDSPQFSLYQENESAARAAVNRAVNDWNYVIEDFNYVDPNLDFQLTLKAGNPLGGVRTIYK